jgi:transposase
MGRAIEIGLREQLIALKQEGHRLAAISEQLNLPYATVRNLSARYKQVGHLAVDYSRCGPQQPTSEALLQRASLWLKRHHPGWGAPLIQLKLRDRYGTDRTPSVRTLQRWFRQQHLTKPRQQVVQPPIGSSKAVHNIWQVDAKENLTLADGSGACYLTITDEHSGAGLQALVFPPPAH